MIPCRTSHPFHGGLRYHTYLPLGVVPAYDPLTKCPTRLVGTWLRYHTYLPLGVVPAYDPLSERPTRLVGTGLRYHT